MLHSLEIGSETSAGMPPHVRQMMKRIEANREEEARFAYGDSGEPDPYEPEQPAYHSDRSIRRSLSTSGQSLGDPDKRPTYILISRPTIIAADMTQGQPLHRIVPSSRNLQAG